MRSFTINHVGAFDNIAMFAVADTAVVRITLAVIVFWNIVSLPQAPPKVLLLRTMDSTAVVPAAETVGGRFVILDLGTRN